MTMKPISRRTMLKGLGVSIALPALEAMMPGLAYTATNTAATAPEVPKRIAFMYVPNGVNMNHWTPASLGSSFELPRILQPLQPFKQDLMVLSGLTLDKARAHGDGGGDHARAMSSFLTGCQPVKTHGADIHVGTSMDQVLAERLGRNSRFPTLEIGCEGGGLSGNCDSGYSCAYSATMSWRTPSTPNPKEINPRALFDRLFGDTLNQNAGRNRSRAELYNQSILDFVADDASRLMQRLGGNDRNRLDEYLTSLRDIERRIQMADNNGEARPRMTRPSGVPGDFGSYLRLMGDLLVMAFQTDSTRIATFVYAIEGSNRSYREIDVREGHHSLSHHQGNRDKLEQITQINHYHITQLAHMLQQMKNIREANGSTLLDNCMLVYGSGNSDGNRHNHDELPILLIGKGGGTLNTGRHLRYPRETPLQNLFLSLADRLGATGIERHGDSTGRLPYLS